MRIRFIGARVTRRLVGQYEWSAATGFLQDVDAVTAAELLTAPGDAFAVDESEPLLALSGLDAHRAGELALAGIGSIAGLTTLGSQGIKGLAGALPWASESKIRQWVRQIRGTAEPEPQENREQQEVES
jgi:hypothetical protein